jgi:tRNA-splicing ligase RtcB
MSELEKIDDYRWRVPKSGQMLVEGIIYGNEKIIEQIKSERVIEQVRNVACLPGIVRASLAMPDAHWGYGFPIGGVAAMDEDGGVVSPGGVGYDINCGCRLMATAIDANDLKGRVAALTSTIFQRIPSGVGSRGDVHLSGTQLKRLLKSGARWAVESGFGVESDLEHTEDGGTLPVGDINALSDRALKRGTDQIGTLGSGNHFVELQVIDKVFDEEAAQAYGLYEGQLTVMIHSGSRGLGYQVCDDSLKSMAREAVRSKIVLPDRQLACALIDSKAATDYFSAMNAAANFAWCNRQVMMHRVREALEDYFRASSASLRLRLVYDVCHNIAKREEHLVEGKLRQLVVHRKGATRAFGPGRKEVPSRYRQVGQPVLIPGDMGRASYVLAANARAMEETFGSTCHGAGRVMSRKAALKLKSGAKVREELEKRGISVQCAGLKTLSEEMPEAYKDVTDVVDSVHGAGIARRVVRMRPLGVIKG